jgi:glycosyltransferase involved in cell wall biosynthesis
MFCIPPYSAIFVSLTLRHMHIGILIDWYLPGYRAGGPIQSASNLVQALGHEHQFSIITTDRDHGSAHPYEGLPADQWQPRPDGSQVYYFSPGQLTRERLFALLDEGGFDWLYVQSMYSQPFGRWPMQWHQQQTGKTRLLLAPRGMLQAGAMRQGYWKKRLYLIMLRAWGLTRGVVFQATDPQERSDIHRYLGKRAEVRLAGNLPRQHQLPWQPSPKVPGKVRWVFASRIHPKKNLPHLLRLMPHLQGEIELDLYGAVEGAAHEAELKALIAALPPGQQVRWQGAQPPAVLQAALGSYHFAVLPTYGENFGHAIFEGLLAGLPVIISDQTPWHDLHGQQLGWDLPLADTKAWLSALQQSIDQDADAYRAWSQAAWEYARVFREDEDLLAQSRALFNPPSCNDA